MSDAILWLFLMTVFSSGIGAGIAFMVPGGEAIGYVLFVFVSIILVIISTSNKQQSNRK